MKGLIAWFAGNHIAANLLMLMIVLAGVITAPTIKQEVFPDLSTDMVQVSVPYPGATPEEVEGSINVRIEERVAGLDGVKRITSTATEGSGSVLVEALEGTDVRVLLDDVKSRVDAIDTFPVDAEEPVVSEVVRRNRTLSIAVSGRIGERGLKRMAERIRDDLTALPEITLVELANARPYEISIEVSETALRRYGATFAEVAEAVRRSSLDLPGGSLRTEGGDILLRAEGQAYRRQDFADLLLRSRPDGTRLVLGDVATVIDGFADTDQSARFDGEPAVLVQVFRVGEQSSLALSGAVREYVDGLQPRLPEGLTVTVWADDSTILRDRLNTLLRNGTQGLALVFLTLALFLQFRLAIWVTLGIPLSFLGALWLMPWLDVSINVLSLFCFILVLGIVVDDAIVIGENAYKKREEGVEGHDAVVLGAQEVSLPVIFGVLTTVAAFLPMLFLPGMTGKVMRLFPLSVIPALLFSLAESQLILPAHLQHVLSRRRESVGEFSSRWMRFQRRFADALEWLIDSVYRPGLERALAWRYQTLATALGVLIVTGAMVGSGWISLTWFPQAEADNVVVAVTMPQGTPRERTEVALTRLASAAEALRADLDAQRPGEASVFRHVLVSVGEQPFRGAQSSNGGRLGSSFSGGHLGEVNVQLAAADGRSIRSDEIARRWRELAGPVPDAVEVSYTASLFSNEPALDIRLSGTDVDVLRTAAERVKAALDNYDGVTEIADSFRSGKQEIEISILPQAEALGLTLSDLARQVRQAFYGLEAQRVQRGREDVKVMVRYPEADRRRLDALETMRIRTPDGREVPFSSVAKLTFGRGFATIERADRRRTVDVTAAVDSTVANANAILSELRQTVLPAIVADYPSVGYSLEGEQRNQRETLGALGRNFLVALLVIYGLMAVPLRSYAQPLIVMTAIPFGITGAVWAHYLLGMSVSFLSIFGIVALVGVVVNDSLVLVDYINRQRAAGAKLNDAVRRAGAARFRPILLTSLTTFAGLTPLLLERTLQAQFLIPMAVSLGFGVIFATLVSLLLVPCVYLVLEDARGLPARVRQARLRRRRRDAAGGSEPVVQGTQMGSRRPGDPRSRLV